MSFDALSLACNIITVIDFGHKFYKTFRDVYDNSVSDPTAEYKANELATLSESLKTSQNRALQSAPNNDQLFRVADKCVKAAGDLQDEIRKLIPSGSSSRATKTLRSLFSATKRTWRHNRIEQLNQSLDECRTTMQTAVLLQMYESGEADRVMRLDEFLKLDSRLQNFIDAVSKQDLHISQLLVDNRLLHQETQAVFRREVTSWRNAQISDGQLTQLKASLKFPEMNKRYNELRTAHEKSFQWLLGDFGATYASDPEHCGRTHGGIKEEPRYIGELRDETLGDFKQWLTSDTDSKLYWISGKPGAGKSTLMKYLFDRMGNEYLLEGQCLVIRHFFWLGVSDTRSRLNDMEGLLMTLLYQLLDQEVSGRSVAAMLLRNNPRIKQNESPTDWSSEELKATTKEALSIVGRQCVVYILIDALDEHFPADKHDELLAAIREFEEMANVRLILSSRREKIFDARLALSRQLQLQTLTGPDIYHFSLGALLKFADFQGPSSEFAEELAMGIVQKAEGVFLWARLAVDSLKRGFIDENSEDVIRDRLYDMPTELSDYFQSIWERLRDDQKRYQFFAANVFSLLSSVANEYMSDSGRGPDPNLLSTGLALNPDDAHSLVHGEAHIKETYLLELCQETERRILSHCAGLVEVRHPHKSPNCTNCALSNIDLTVSRKVLHFVHRSAKEFFKETPEGKRIIDFNDMAQDGPSFRFTLGYLARLAAFRDLRNTFHRCSLLERFSLRRLLHDISRIEATSAISTEQRHSLIALTRKLHFRFSGHPDNPIFKNWVTIGRLNPYHILPFIITATECGHGDYALQYIEMEARSGRGVPIETYGMLLKASLEDCLDDTVTWLLDSGQGRSRLKSLEKLIHHFQTRAFPSTMYHGRLGMISTWRRSSSCPSICHLFFHMLLHMTSADKSIWKIPTRLADTIIDAALNLAKLLGTSDTGLFQPLLCTFSKSKRGSTLYIATYMDLVERSASPARAEYMNVVFEVSPIWLIRHIAQTAMCIQGLGTFCGSLMDLVEVQCQNGREVQRPRPVLLLGSSRPTELGRNAYLAWNGVKEISNEAQGELSEILHGLLVEHSDDRYDAFVQRLREIWVDTSVECLRETDAKELFISSGLLCSEEDEQKIFKACNILAVDGDPFRKSVYVSDDYYGGRFMLPPYGCSEEEKRLSYYLVKDRQS